jgi:transposase-like protein
LIDIRHNGKIECVYCNHNKVCTVKDGDFKYSKCNRRFTVKTGSIFDDSKVSLKKWFMVIYLANSNKKGVNSHAVARQIGVTQKTSWFMLQRIKNASVGVMFKNEFEGTIEVDECYVGGSKTHHQKNTRINI